MYRLIVEKGRLRGKRWVIDRPSATLGHAETCDLKLPDEGMDPLEARIEEQDGKLYLYQPGTVDGADSEAVERMHALNHGDRLIIGNVRLRLDAPQLVRKGLQVARANCWFHRATLVGVVLLLALQAFLLVAVLVWRQHADTATPPVETPADPEEMPDYEEAAPSS